MGQRSCPREPGDLRGGWVPGRWRRSWSRPESLPGCPGSRVVLSGHSWAKTPPAPTLDLCTAAPPAGRGYARDPAVALASSWRQTAARGLARTPDPPGWGWSPHLVGWAEPPALVQGWWESGAWLLPEPLPPLASFGQTWGLGKQAVLEVSGVSVGLGTWGPPPWVGADDWLGDLELVPIFRCDSPSMC